MLGKSSSCQLNTRAWNSETTIYLCWISGVQGFRPRVSNPVKSLGKRSRIHQLSQNTHINKQSKIPHTHTQTLSTLEGSKKDNYIWEILFLAIKVRRIKQRCYKKAISKQTSILE